MTPLQRRRRSPALLPPASPLLPRRQPACNSQHARRHGHNSAATAVTSRTQPDNSRYCHASRSPLFTPNHCTIFNRTKHVMVVARHLMSPAHHDTVFPNVTPPAALLRHVHANSQHTTWLQCFHTSAARFSPRLLTDATRTTVPPSRHYANYTASVILSPRIVI